MNLIITMSLAGSIPIVVYYLFGIIGQKKYSAVWERKIIKLSIFFFLCPIQCIKYRLPNDIAHINLLQGQTEKKWYLSKSGFSVVKNVVGDKVLRTDWLIYLKYFWIFLTLSFVVWQIVKYYKLKIKLIQTSKTEEKTAFAEKIVRTYIGKKRKIYFLRNPCIKTPFTIGILNHYIVLPELEFNKQEMEMIYIHEAIHIKNRDIFYKIVCLGILSIHCFNPLAWLLLYEYGKIIERNCDEIVIQKFFKKEERKIYARLLINLAADKSEIPVIFKDNLSRGKNKC